MGVSNTLRTIYNVYELQMYKTTDKDGMARIRKGIPIAVVNRAYVEAFGVEPPKYTKDKKIREIKAFVEKQARI